MVVLAVTPSRPNGRFPLCERATLCVAVSRALDALSGLTLVTFLLLLDDTAVAVALPTIQRQLGLDLGGQE
jgi:hypothetical protein